MKNKIQAAGVGITHKGSVLLAKRIEKYKGKPVSYPGYWSIFTGTVDDGESLIDCAARELMEESQIKLDPKTFTFIKTISREDTDLSVFFVESDELLVPILNEESTGYGWFSINSLDSFTEKLDDEILNSIKTWHSKCK